MKILCLCHQGNVRSVAMAYMLKSYYKQDAIAAGIDSNSRGTIEMLFNWMDFCIVMETSIVQKLNSFDAVEKCLVCDVGPDIGVTVGVSHAFALPGLLPGGGR